MILEERKWVWWPIVGVSVYTGALILACYRREKSLMITKFLVGLAVSGVSIVAFAGTASAAPLDPPGAPGALVITTGEGVALIPPGQVGVEIPPPVIVIDGVVVGFHAGGT